MFFITEIITARYNTKEFFNLQKNQYFVLLGDSVLKNNDYVSDKKSVEELLLERTNGQTHCFAMDDASILDVYGQITNIPKYLNTKHTTIFLSVGGNNILSNFVEDPNNNNDKNLLATIFTEYKELIRKIKTNLPYPKLVLFDLYYPPNLKYHQYYPIIKEWNNLLYKYIKENRYYSFKISNILTRDDDFTSDIEPSTIGSKKIVDSIMNTY
jgi:hypothetical protein